MIVLDDVSVVYADATTPVIDHASLAIPEGELCLVVGPSGSGKTTLLRLINGLVPHFSGGTLHGRVLVDGRDTRTHPPRELADLVGFVGQDPSAGFVTDVVEDELAYGMESMGLPPDVMRRRVEETLDLLALAPLRRRALRTLSGGERQRVAIGAAMTTHPRILVLDEPTSALDPSAADEVLSSLQRLVHDLGMTVLLAEHRLERVVQYADRVILVPGDGAPLIVGEPATVMKQSPVAPPVVELGRAAGWSTTPLSIRDARRAAAGLRERLSIFESAVVTPTGVAPIDEAPPLLELRNASVGYGRREVLHGIDLRIGTGEVVAVMGRNGAGKSTLLSTMVGLRVPFHGVVRVLDADPASLRPRDLVARIGLVPQQAADLLYAESVGHECALTDRDSGLNPGTTAAMLHSLAPWVQHDMHPGDLSEGSRLALALAVVLAPDPPVLLLDEPTRGLDYTAKQHLVDVIARAAERGRAVVLATHDVELAAEVATRTLIIADGEIVADGPTSRIVTSSPMFAPQIAKTLAPLPFLTVADVTRALDSLADAG
jgi:energy-coupling factor transporter ATP-binding protein EcfA2